MGNDRLKWFVMLLYVFRRSIEETLNTKQPQPMNISSYCFTFYYLCLLKAVAECCECRASHHGMTPVPGAEAGPGLWGWSLAQTGAQWVSEPAGDQREVSVREERRERGEGRITGCQEVRQGETEDSHVATQTHNLLQAQGPAWEVSPHCHCQSSLYFYLSYYYHCIS